MSPTDLRVQPPVRHRPETEIEQNLRVELNTLREDVYGGCALLEARLSALYPVTVELGPSAQQMVIGSMRVVDALQRRVTR